MVNQKELLEFVRAKFRFMHTYEAVKITVSPDLKVNVVEVFPGSGSLRCDESLPDGVLPFEFGICKASLVFEDCGLRSLKGCPKRVEGRFVSLGNNLENLEGGPTYVSGKFWIRQDKPLESLDGFPAQVDEFARLDYSRNLPLLRTLNCREGVILLPVSDDTNKVMEIMQPYKGQGKMAIFDCQKDLEDSGFEENARW